MVKKCPICSEDVFDGIFCTYCGTKIDEELSNDFGLFNKVKNSIFICFDIGISKKEINDFKNFLNTNNDKIAEFINLFEKEYHNEFLDIKNIKKEYGFIYKTISKITDYFQKKKFNLSINQRKYCYTFKRIYEDVDTYVKKFNSQFCLNVYKKNLDELNKLNDFFSTEIPDELITDKIKEDLKDKFKSLHDSLFQVYEYCLKNPNILTSQDLDKITIFNSNYTDFDLNISKLNNAYKLSVFLKENKPHILSFNKIINKKYIETISDAKLNEIKDEYSIIFSNAENLINTINDEDFSNEDDKNLILSFIENYSNINYLILKINCSIEFNNIKNDLEEFINYDYGKISVLISDKERNKFKNNFTNTFNTIIKLDKINKEYNFFTDNESQLITEFIEHYNNFDKIITNINIKLFYNENKENINELVGFPKKNLNHHINKIEKQKIKDIFTPFYNKLVLIEDFQKHIIFNTEILKSIEEFIDITNNIDELVIEKNVNFCISTFICYVNDLIKICKVLPEEYICNSKRKELILEFGKIGKKIQKIEDKYFKYISTDYKLIFEVFHKKHNYINEYVSYLNRLYTENELKVHEDFFNDIDGKSLDYQQRDAIVVDEEAVKVVASAGSGKTLTIQGKVKYLIEKKDISPDEILIISFSNASVEDLKKRIPEHVDIKTFHKLGKSILSDNNQYSRPDVYALDYVIKNYLVNKALTDENLSKRLIEFFSFYIHILPDFDKIKSKGDLIDWQAGTDFSTLKSKFKNENKETLNREIVKSYEELYIANFLFIHGVKYEYEKNYTAIYENFNDAFLKFKELLFDFDLDIPDYLKEEFTNNFLYLTDICKSVEINEYCPDFYLEDYDIYLEHFGVDRNCKNSMLGNVGSKEYVESMKWKRNIHQKYNTTLIETYSYYQKEHRLLTRLSEKLKEKNVKLEEINYSKVYKQLLDNNTIREWESFRKLLKTFITLFKGNNYNKEKFKEFNKFIDNEFFKSNQERTKAFLQFVEEIYDAYEEYLAQQKKIDFDDMINNASDCIVKYGLNLPYKYIIVDEFQDTSFTRFNLLKNIKESLNAKIMVVGDDWQSIYGFTGCDVSIFNKFDTFFDICETRFIETTYRNSQELLDVSSNFIMKNPKQIKKELKSYKSLKNPIKLFTYYSKQEIFKLESIIKDIIQKSEFENKEIFILGRNNNDIFNLLQNKYNKQDIFLIKGNKNTLYNNKYLEVIYNKRPDIKIYYRTVHQSKGLEMDNVILINLKNHKVGFPNKIIDDPLLSFVKRNDDTFEYAEERRLFYVALTRTKNYVYLLVPSYNESIFVSELIENSNVSSYESDIKEVEFLLENDYLPVIPTNLNCPICKTGKILLKFIKNENGIFKIFNCSNNQSPPFNHCEWKGGFYNGEISDLENISFCNECDGIFYKRPGKYGPFYTCSNYPDCDGNEKFVTNLKCSFCGENLYHVTKRENGFQMVKCFNEYCSFKYFQCNKSDLKHVQQCPVCGGFLVVRYGPFGSFLGCTSYPHCNYTKNL